MTIPVFVECDQFTAPLHVKKMKKYGLRWNKTNGFSGSSSRRDYEQEIKPYCQREHLKCRIDNKYGSRSTDYRHTFFKNNRPAIGKYYFCAYCGKLLTYRTLTVDHLYPVGCAKDSVALQKKLHRMGIKSINDPKNLVAACFSCNRRKSKNMGGWILRGKLGRSNTFWKIRHLVRISLLVILVAFFVYMMQDGALNNVVDTIKSWL